MARRSARILDTILYRTLMPEISVGARISGMIVNDFFF